MMNSETTMFESQSAMAGTSLLDELVHKTPPPELSDFGGGVRLMVALFCISAIVIQRRKFGSLKSIYVCRSFSS